MYLIKNYPHIFKIEDTLGQLIPFRPNEAQQLLLDLIYFQLENPSKNGMRKAGQVRINVPKARQLGLSTYIKLIELSLAIENMGWNTFTVAHDNESSEKIFKKIKTAFNNLPENFRQLLTLENDNLTNLVFSGKGELMTSNLSTSTSGRGGTYQVLHISELGKMSETRGKWEETFAGTLPAVESAKYVFYESTCDGGLGKYYNLTMAIERGETEFDNLFLPWFLVSKYSKQAPVDQGWRGVYQDLARRYNLYLEPEKQFGINKDQFYWYYSTVQKMHTEGVGDQIKVQYPFSLEEAFVSEARNKFDLNQVKNLEIRTPIKVIDSVKIYRLPDEGQIYSLGIDPSSGLGKDWSTLTLRGFYPNEKGVHLLYAQMKAKTSQRSTAQTTVNLADIYNQNGKVIIVPEVNGLGSSVIDYLLDHYNNSLIYKRYVQDITKQLDARIPDFGWSTNNKTRDLMINNFANMFHDGKLEVINQDEKAEMIVFVWNDEKRRYEALQNEHDDILFSDMMSVAGFDYIRERGIV